MVDFPTSLEKGSFCAKSCVSVELDELRRRLNGLPDLLQVVAEEEKERLPKEVGACVVSYIPHVGYLVAMPIKRALQEQGFDYHNIPGQLHVREQWRGALQKRVYGQFGREVGRCGTGHHQNGDGHHGAGFE